MPKKVNAHRLASQAIHLSDALSAAAEGKYDIGLIEKALGNCSFRVALCGKSGGTRIVAITSRVLRGGRSSAARAEAGHYLIIDNKEVLGVVNTQKDLKALVKAGRVSDAASGLDEFFEVDRSAEKSGEQDIWAKRDEERLALADEYAARIRRRRAGLLARNTAAPLLSLADDGVDAPEEAEEPAEEVAEQAAPAAAAAADRKMITSARRLRKLELAAAAEDAALMAELAARKAALEARWAAEDAAEEKAASMENWVAPDSWEVDIDAI
jgi:hypothetical protein